MKQNAILSGDALLTLCFEWLSQCEAPTPYPPGQIALEIARASGSQGVIGGQVEDIAAEGKTPSPDVVDFIHHNKTAALIRAATRVGGVVSGASEQDLEALTRYGNDVGLAFQIVDDILNVTSTAPVLGKATGSDDDRGKMTYIAVHGIDASRAEATKRIDSARQAIASLPGNKDPLDAIAQYVIDREH